MSGLLEKFEVATDTLDQLINAIKILLVWNSRVTHFKTGGEGTGKPYLTLLWSDASGGQPLIAPLEKPEAIADQIYAWLRTVDFGDQPDTDGSNNKGWRIIDGSPQNPGSHDFYAVCTVYPEWITYGK